jgi:hypothetical protein
MTYVVRNVDLADLERLETLPLDARDDVQRVPLLDAFALRCEAQATLVAAGADLHEAVDELQAAAWASGLVAVIGQDAVQEIMNDAFSPNQPKQDVWPPPNWIEYGVPVARQQNRRGAPRVTVEAVMCAFRESGCNAAVLERPENRERLSRMSQQQRNELRERMKAWSLQHAA